MTARMSVMSISGQLRLVTYTGGTSPFYDVVVVSIDANGNEREHVDSTYADRTLALSRANYLKRTRTV